MHNEVIVIKNQVKNTVTITVKNIMVNETTQVTFDDFWRCMRELKLNNVNQMADEFKSVCNWFMKQEQYTEFEEIKK